MPFPIWLHITVLEQSPVQPAELVFIWLLLVLNVLLVVWNFNRLAFYAALYLTFFFSVQIALFILSAKGTSFDFKSWAFKGHYEISLIIGTLAASALAVFTAGYVVRRDSDSKKQIELQEGNLDQQRFSDALTFLDSQQEFLVLAALISIQTICKKQNAPFYLEATTILRTIIVSNTPLPSQVMFDHLLKPRDQTTVSPVPKTMSVAIKTLLELVNLHRTKFFNFPSRELFQDRNFAGVQFTDFEDLMYRFELRSVRFNSCDLRYASFSSCILDDVVFWSSTNQQEMQNNRSTLLCDADFTGAQFNNCIFFGNDISGAKFLACSGLGQRDLLRCLFDASHPPSGLPDNLLLQFPYQFENDEQKFLVGEKLDDWLKATPDFKRHTIEEDGQEIEVLITNDSRLREAQATIDAQTIQPS